MSDQRLDYEQFEKTVFQNLEAMMPESVAFTPTPVQKNNGVIKNGFEIRTDQRAITPVIYPDDYYLEYLSGNSVVSICEQIVQTICEFQEVPEKDIGDILSYYENARDRIVLRLINYERNKKQLENIPYIPFLDLAIVFYLLLEDNKDSRKRVLITNELASFWNTTCKQLYDQALKNSPRILPWKILGLKEIIGVTFANMLSVPVYVLTNPAMLYGAACILYKDVLRKFAEEIHESFYIIPSSVHEVLLFPLAAGMAAEDILEMIHEANSRVVEEKDFLSDSLYMYNQEENRLVMVSQENMIPGSCNI